MVKRSSWFQQCAVTLIQTPWMCVYSEIQNGGLWEFWPAGCAAEHREAVPCETDPRVTGPSRSSDESIDNTFACSHRRPAWRTTSTSSASPSRRGCLSSWRGRRSTGCVCSPVTCDCLHCSCYHDCWLFSLKHERHPIMLQRPSQKSKPVLLTGFQDRTQMHLDLVSQCASVFWDWVTCFSESCCLYVFLWCFAWTT